LPPPFDDYDYPIGLYINDPADFLDTILFTNCGLYLLTGKLWTRLLYSEIEKVEPPISKSKVTGLKIIRHDGSELPLPIRGIRADRFYDAFEVLRFLDRVRADIEMPM
jgi:hypothetical protein